jgi:hypothetical protein
MLKQKPRAKVEAGNPDGSGGAVTGAVEEFGEVCGGKGGVPYLAVAKPPERIKRVTVWHREYVDGIELDTDVGVLPMIGGKGRSRDIRKESFELAQGEFLIGISIECWQYIDRITFHTNKGNYGPYGGNGGTVKKSLYVPTGRVVAGFKGRHWEFVDSIQLMIL